VNYFDLTVLGKSKPSNISRHCKKLTPCNRQNMAVG